MLVAEVEGLSKRYGAVQALDGVDVAIEPGCTGLVGSNGAGKSTLIKLLLGLLVPDQGRAIVLGHDVAVDPLAVRAQVGYLPEGACLPGDVTAADFVAFMAQLGGLPPRPARERAAEVCYQVGLEEERYRAVGGFSTGMQQRVKLAVALVHDPSFLLLDEPTDGMDPQGREDMLDLIARIRGELGDRRAGLDPPARRRRAGLRPGGHGPRRPRPRPGLDRRGRRHHRARLRHPARRQRPRGAGRPGRGRPGGPSARRGEELLVQGPSDLVRDVAAQRGWPLRRLVPRAPSLEETFLRLQAAHGGAPLAQDTQPAPTPEAAWGVRR